ncbi:MAG: magnesium transporter [Planctomycetaceae bacterium]|nr:magnesium transporter [Planctomycetaceae bacterium]
MSASVTDDILDQPVTQHMRFDFCRLRADRTVAEALADLRVQQPQGRIVYFYVTDERDHLEGVVPTRRLLLSPPDARIREIMVTKVVTIDSSADVRAACDLFLKHKFLAFPVMHGDRMVGIVDVELFAEGIDDLERTKQQDDLFQLIGVHVSPTQQVSPWEGFTSRFPWLLCNIAGGILAAVLANMFEGLLKNVVALALFVPVVLALSESVAIQSVTLALLVLHNKPCTLAELVSRVLREAATGLLLGLACGCIMGIVALAWLGHAQVAFCLIVGIGLGVMFSAAFGLALPLVLRLTGRDPQVASGPIALVIADMITLTIYFSVAQRLLG